MQMFDYIIGFIFEELTFSLNDLLFRGGSGDRGSGNEVNPLFRVRGDGGVFENLLAGEDGSGRKAPSYRTVQVPVP